MLQPNVGSSGAQLALEDAILEKNEEELASFKLNDIPNTQTKSALEQRH